MQVIELRNPAAKSEYGHDRTRAAFVDAYGGNPHAEPVMPPRFVTAYRTAAYSDGVTACVDDVK